MWQKSFQRFGGNSAAIWTDYSESDSTTSLLSIAILTLQATGKPQTLLNNFPESTEDCSEAISAFHYVGGCKSIVRLSCLVFGSILRRLSHRHISHNHDHNKQQTQSTLSTSSLPGISLVNTLLIAYHLALCQDLLYKTNIYIYTFLWSFYQNITQTVETMWL